MKGLPVRKNIRLKYYDYRQDGYYFVTICSSNCHSNLVKYEKLSKEILYSLPQRFPDLKIDYFVLMPTHLHIVFIFELSKVNLGEVVRTYKALITKKTGIKNFWQRGYYEHVIRSEKALSKIMEYIQNNPAVQNIKFEKFYEDNEAGLINQTPTSFKNSPT